MEQRLTCLQPPSLSQRLCSAIGKPLLKGPVAFPMVTEAAAPTGLDLLDPWLQAAPGLQAMPSSPGLHLAHHLSGSAEQKADRASVECMDKTTAAQRLQVSLPGSGRARIGIEEKGQRPCHKACSWQGKHQHRPTQRAAGEHVSSGIRSKQVHILSPPIVSCVPSAPRVSGVSPV